MRTTLIKSLAAVAIATVAAFGADSSVGTWKLNTDKSTYTPAPMPVKSLTSTRVGSDGGVTVTSKGERTDGTVISTSYTAKYDGTAVPVKGYGAPYDTLALKRVDANTYTDERKKTGGQYHATGRTTISEDGKLMTWRSSGTGADGKPFTSTFVYDKQ
ncbi:MAG: hypothetical protein QOJ99_1349 [Bryobacterales bacterium]|jgi:hypothetical protein|nr:hypothetical protein [Bryobacterales bacterium]